MIKKIGVIYEDANSLGFLRGLRDRLDCDAELLRPTTAIGRTTHLTRKTARHAWRYFWKQGVDLVVRFMDADVDRWQDVRRAEQELFPAEAAGLFICGVALHEVEDWLALDLQHIAGVLELNPDELKEPAHRADRIKRALARIKRSDEDMSELVARIVREAPHAVFRRWLEDNALRCFYSDCRSAAAREDCETPNELDAPA